jgi:hypothetical protein
MPRRDHRPRASPAPAVTVPFNGSMGRSGPEPPARGRAGPDRRRVDPEQLIERDASAIAELPDHERRRGHRVAKHRHVPAELDRFPGTQISSGRHERAGGNGRHAERYQRRSRAALARPRLEGCELATRASGSPTRRPRSPGHDRRRRDGHRSQGVRAGSPRPPGAAPSVRRGGLTRVQAGLWMSGIARPMRPRAPGRDRRSGPPLPRSRRTAGSARDPPRAARRPRIDASSRRAARPVTRRRQATRPA